jgi:hypothetical protein
MYCLGQTNIRKLIIDVFSWQQQKHHQKIVERERMD